MAFGRVLPPRSITRLDMLLPVLAFCAALWPAQASAWWNEQWTLRKKITIDTGPSGASINDAVGAAPVLIRLHVGNFRFAAAKEDGGDLRFIAADEKTPLKHHVEKYDSLLGEALVWVNVPDIKPGTKSDVWLYFGNAKAPAAVDAKGTYDADTIIVHHFADRATPPQDVSAWGNHAQNAAIAADGAIIGQGARLDGQNGVVLSAAPSLAVAEGAEFSWSLWVKMTAAQGKGALYTHAAEGGNGLVLSLDNGVFAAEVTVAGARQRSTEAAAISAGAWHHLAAVAKGAQITLFVDGNVYATLSSALPAISGAPVLGQATAAAPPAASADAPTENAGTSAEPGHAGDIDELQIAKVARPAGFIKFASLAQGPENAKLLSFSVDEENAGWFSGGYFGVILRSVTLDGWVVIGLLAIMAVISWFVMVDRVSYLNRVAKGNKAFLKYFRESAAAFDDFLQLDHEKNDGSLGGAAHEKDHKMIHASPLYRLFGAGAQELSRRFRTTRGHRRLSPQAIESIRAVLDSGFVQESQRLNRQMVMLTIAISGGPFLGLLGTVVGVMITFAAIAASGDVNVNAIAPGIAAALVATVAGLGVAIPSLFGYNYLITRIKDATSDMQVFIDEFVTRLAESYDREPDDLMKHAAE